MRALICDDDAACRFVARRLLTRLLGWTVTECGDGVEALEILARDRFDMALIDLQLPRLSGIEVVEAIRESPATRDLRVVILSQERHDDVVRKLAALGVSAYLIKPLREETVAQRIAPLAIGISAHQPEAASDKTSLRLTPDTPALLADGDANYRRLFVEVASRYGPVIEAESGAKALALFRQSRAGVLFVGENLGLMSPEALVRKFRAEVDHPSRIVGIVNPSAQQAVKEGLFDAIIPRLFQPDLLAKELHAFARVPGPLSTLEDAAPHFGDCLTSAVKQVFGMMTNLEVISAASDEPNGNLEAAVGSIVNIDVNGRSQVTLEFRMPWTLIKSLSAKMLMCDAAEVTEEHCVSTSGELANMVIGRLDNWFKDQSLPSRCSLPENRLNPAGQAAAEPSEHEGFTSRFTFPESGLSFALSVQARDSLSAR